MADPLSITISVIALIKATGQAGLLLHQFCVDLGGINVTLTGLLSDVASFKHVLETMKDTFDQEEMKTNLTGHVGKHWKNVAKALHDSEETLKQLNELLESVNKKAKILDGPRKVMRFKSSVEQIGLFREQIQSYRGMLETSLTTIIVVNQITFQKSNEDNMEQSNADLHALFVEIRDQVKSLNHKIETSERASDTFDGAAGSRRERMMNLRECYRSAADVVSTTSSTLTVKVAPKGAKSVVYGSDLGDILPKEESEAMRRWLSSRTVAGDDFAPTIGPDDAIAEEIYESDSDFEGEMVQALFDEAIRLKDEEHLESAASKLRNCLSLASEEDTQSIKCVTRPEILEALVDTYWMMKSWGHARAMLAEKMSITERQYGTKGAIFMWDTLNLATLMMKDAKYVEAHLQGRRALQGFRRLKEPGRLGYEKSLMLLIELSKIREKKDEEDAYVTLLAGHQAKGLPPKDLDSSINAVTKQRGRSAKADTDDRAIHKVEPPKETKAEPTAERLVKSELIVPQYSSAQQDLIYKLRGTSFIPVTLEEIWCVMIQTEAVRRTHSVELDIVAQFGRDISGKVPQWSTCYDGKGWSCLLTFDASREILVSHLRSEEMAKGAALSAACHRFLPHRMTEIRENGDKISDPISDKVVFVAKDTSAEIMRSQPTLVVGIDFGVSDTAVAYRYVSDYSQEPRNIKIWPGSPTKSDDRVPSTLAFNEVSGDMTWGFLARMKLEEYGWVDAMPGFRELLKDEHRETYNQAQPTSRTVKSKQDVIMLHVQYLAWLYDCLKANLERNLALIWTEASICFTFSYPVWMTYSPSQIRDFQQALSLAGFEQHPKHRIVLELSEPRAVISTILYGPFNVYKYQTDNFVVCELGATSSCVTAWRWIKDSSSAPAVRELKLERQLDGKSSLADFNLRLRRHISDRLSNIEMVAWTIPYDYDLVAEHICNAQEFVHARDHYISKDASFLPRHFTVAVPGLRSNYTNLAAGIVYGQINIDSFSVLRDHAMSLVNSIDELLLGREYMFLDRHWTHVLLCGDCGILPYFEWELTGYYKSEKTDSLKSSGILVRAVDEPGLCVAKGLVLEQINKLNKPRW